MTGNGELSPDCLLNVWHIMILSATGPPAWAYLETAEMGEILNSGHLMEAWMLLWQIWAKALWPLVQPQRVSVDLTLQSERLIAGWDSWEHESILPLKQAAHLRASVHHWSGKILPPTHPHCTLLVDWRLAQYLSLPIEGGETTYEETNSTGNLHLMWIGHTAKLTYVLSSHFSFIFTPARFINTLWSSLLLDVNPALLLIDWV